ncbi:MAG TPA: FkbM family methyltransferase [Castellaniella sp.]|uniref:FkbM family methyltransferase n=1 Tax=Castellaniella sp. TaxID=1955812 RepID=UPI002EDC9A00
MIKKLVKDLMRSRGWELHRLNVANNSSAQLLAALTHTKSNLVFDIGANVGQFAWELRATGFEGQIISFEPLSSAHDQLADAARSDPAWVVHERAAVGDRDGEIDINVSGNSLSSSVLPILATHLAAAAESAYVAVERTPLVRLDSVADRYTGPESRPFIKIDTQGFEWQVLDGAAEALKRARGVYLELSMVPLYEGQRLWREVIGRLEDEGFVLWTLQQGFVDRRTGQSLQLDGIFLRREFA